MMQVAEDMEATVVVTEEGEAAVAVGGAMIEGTATETETATGTTATPMIGIAEGTATGTGMTDTEAGTRTRRPAKIAETDLTRMRVRMGVAVYGRDRGLLRVTFS